MAGGFRSYSVVAGEMEEEVEAAGAEEALGAEAEAGLVVSAEAAAVVAVQAEGGSWMDS